VRKFLFKQLRTVKNLTYEDTDALQGESHGSKCLNKIFCELDILIYTFLVSLIFTSSFRLHFPNIFEYVAWPYWF
jgi:hypothetical protein